MNLALSVWLSVGKPKSQSWLISFFWFFLHEIRQPQSEESDEAKFLKNSPIVSG